MKEEREENRERDEKRCKELKLQSNNNVSDAVKIDAANAERGKGRKDVHNGKIHQVYSNFNSYKYDTDNGC